MLTEKLKELFGKKSLTWPKLILFAVLAGVYAALVAIIPALHYTSFITITVTLEVWILFGILIIMNSKSNMDSALKCFVFFLISQPLIYLIQVPFSWQGWGLFKYYRYWFIITVLCLPMGFIGYYMKKDKWWGLLILLPMIVLTAYSYMTYITYFMFYSPRYILICLFCIIAMLVYPIAIFDNKKIKAVGTAISCVLIIAATVICLLKPHYYSTEIMGNNEEHSFDDSYSVYLGDSKYGDVDIRYVQGAEDYMVHAEFKRGGATTLTLESPTGEKTEYDLYIDIDTYDLEKKQAE